MRCPAASPARWDTRSGSSGRPAGARSLRCADGSRQAAWRMWPARLPRPPRVPSPAAPGGRVRAMAIAAVYCLGSVVLLYGDRRWNNASRPWCRCVEWDAAKKWQTRCCSWPRMRRLISPAPNWWSTAGIWHCRDEEHGDAGDAIVCDDDGHEATVTDVVTLKKEAHERFSLSARTCPELRHAEWPSLLLEAGWGVRPVARHVKAFLRVPARMRWRAAFAQRG